jgi:hypothetical protein
LNCCILLSSTVIQNREIFPIPFTDSEPLYNSFTLLAHTAISPVVSFALERRLLVEVDAPRIFGFGHLRMRLWCLFFAA